MQRPGDSAVLQLWEHGSRRDALGRALLLTQAALGKPEAEVARLSIGERDRLLLQLRAALFGRHMEAAATCAACGEALEFSVDASALLEALPPPQQQHYTLSDGRQFRLPQAGDLSALAKRSASATAHPADARQFVQLLMQRCQLEGETTPLNAAQLAEAELHIERLDPAADLQLAYQCPQCAHCGSEALQIDTWLWNELSQRAQRLLDEVHLLASHYGWDESQILALGEPRRRAYLERCLA